MATASAKASNPPSCSSRTPGCGCSSTGGLPSVACRWDGNLCCGPKELKSQAVHVKWLTHPQDPTRRDCIRVKPTHPQKSGHSTRYQSPDMNEKYVNSPHTACTPSKSLGSHAFSAARAKFNAHHAHSEAKIKELGNHPAREKPPGENENTYTLC